MEFEQRTVVKQITAKRCTEIHLWLPIQRGNMRNSNITFIDALPSAAAGQPSLRKG